MIHPDIIKKFFPNFTQPELLEAISKEGLFYEFEPGTLVIDIGMPIPFVPLLLRGSMRVIRRDDNDHELLLYYLNAGETCASSLTCCMDHSMSEVEAVAEDFVELIGVPAKYVDPWMEKYPEWKAYVMSSYRKRFDELMRTIDAIAFHQLDERLVQYLLEKSAVHKTKTLKTSHQEIANDLHSSREVISRLLKQLEKQGRLRLGRNVIEIVGL